MKLVRCRCGTELTRERARRGCVCGEKLCFDAPKAGMVSRRHGGSPKAKFVYSNGELKRC